MPNAYKVLRDIPAGGYGPEFGFVAGETVYGSTLITGVDHCPDPQIAITRDPAGDGGYYRKVPLDVLDPIAAKPMTRDELIAALERAPGPDRQLDEEIATLVGLSDAQENDADVVAFGRRLVDIPKYTASRDAMLPGAEKLCWQIEGPMIGDTDSKPWKAAALGKDIWIGRAATEPLARRIAEIKALVKP